MIVVCCSSDVHAKLSCAHTHQLNQKHVLRTSEFTSLHINHVYATITITITLTIVMKLRLTIMMTVTTVTITT